MTTKFNMYQLFSAQELFYTYNHRYANTQEELIDAGFIDKKLESLITEKELTDKDGNGIEGGDDNPETWSVAAYIPYREIDNWCRVVSKEHWLTCNQNGCYEEK